MTDNCTKNCCFMGKSAVIYWKLWKHRKQSSYNCTRDDFNDEEKAHEIIPIYSSHNIDVM